MMFEYNMYFVQSSVVTSQKEEPVWQNVIRNTQRNVEA